MAIVDLFHKRQKKARGEMPDIYLYDAIPKALRVQIVHIMHEIMGDETVYFAQYDSRPLVRMVYEDIVRILRKELAVFVLPNYDRGYEDNYLEELRTFLLTVDNTDQFLSALELICNAIQKIVCKFDYRRFPKAQKISSDAILEINSRFKEHGVGYEYDGEIIRIDSEFVHSEVVKESLSLLRDEQYKGAEEEFLKAHEHYRKGNPKEALNESLKAFESLLKSICDRRGWQYTEKDTASKLIQICMDNELIPKFWQSYFSALRTTLEAGVPTARNKRGGHGQGAIPVSVPDHIVAYVLHMTSAALVFLVRAEKELA